MTEKHPESEEWANCASCGSAHEVRVLDERGVCPMCMIPRMKASRNPHLERR